MGADFTAAVRGSFTETRTRYTLRNEVNLEERSVHRRSAAGLELSKNGGRGILIGSGYAGINGLQ